MSDDPEWLIEARKDGRILSETGVRPAGECPAAPPVDRPADAIVAKKRGRPERDFQTDVLALAKEKGWRTAHFRPAWTEANGRKRMITAVAGDGKGFPDCLLLRGARLVACELKATTQVKAEQMQWLLAWQRVGAETFCWTAEDWPEIERVLC